MYSSFHLSGVLVVVYVLYTKQTLKKSNGDLRYSFYVSGVLVAMCVAIYYTDIEKG